MRKLIASAWLSLDGVFDTSTFDEWFIPYMSESRNNHIQQQNARSGAKLYGRHTYEELFAYWSPLKNNEMGIADKLNSMPKYVVSNTLVKAEWNNTTILQDDIPKEVADLKQQPGGNIMIDGSATLVQSLLPTGLIDEIHLLVHPVVVGSGKRYFKENTTLNHLELLDSELLENGVLLLRYKTPGK